jgi:hypothetical protein
MSTVWQAAGRPTDDLTQVVYWLFLVALTFSALGAYQVGPIPLPWLGDMVMIAVAMLLLVLELRLPSLPACGLFAIWMASALTITVAGWVMYQSEVSMPAVSTSSYPVFIVLRLVTLASFLCTVYVVAWLLTRVPPSRIHSMVCVVGALLALFAIYVYIAQIAGLPEPPRTRMGTGGDEQRTTFTYAFHRAMGSFREPAHLAEWLILPLFLSLREWSNLRRSWMLLAIASVILLSGSLTGILGAIAGMTGATALFMARGSYAMHKPLLGMAIAVSVGLLAFAALVKPNSNGSVSLTEVIWDRVEPMLAGRAGIQASNRGYVIDYLYAQDHIMLIGIGLGNSNLILTEDRGSTAVTSFLSVYVNAYFSTGLIGIILLSAAILTPVLLLGFTARSNLTFDLWCLLAAYLTWMVMFTVSSEELNWSFALTYTLFAASLRDCSMPRQIIRKVALRTSADHP